MVTNRDRKSLDCGEKIREVVQTTGTIDVFDPSSGILGPNPLTGDAQLLSYWFSQNPAVFQD